MHSQGIQVYGTDHTLISDNQHSSVLWHPKQTKLHQGVGDSDHMMQRQCTAEREELIVQKLKRKIDFVWVGLIKQTSAQSSLSVCKLLCCLKQAQDLGQFQSRPHWCLLTIFTNDCSKYEDAHLFSPATVVSLRVVVCGQGRRMAKGRGL